MWLFHIFVFYFLGIIFTRNKFQVPLLCYFVEKSNLRFFKKIYSNLLFDSFLKTQCTNHEVCVSAISFLYATSLHVSCLSARSKEGWLCAICNRWFRSLSIMAGGGRRRRKPIEATECKNAKVNFYDSIDDQSRFGRLVVHRRVIVHCARLTDENINGISF
jgi:hypothetical protein